MMGENTAALSISRHKISGFLVYTDDPGTLLAARKRIIRATGNAIEKESFSG
ncbi:hypothetical protein [Desertivirga arenae]|uniref:hypothetical protein n=1 Tax=Desertivirga arenae TaxID=2810309 RepID=UPI001A96E42B|nr:hypothetical protein [Pedobacter sp. SYSU D00823]